MLHPDIWVALGNTRASSHPHFISSDLPTSVHHIMSELEKKDSIEDSANVDVSAVSAHDAGVTDEGLALANDPHR
jgi:hypothetical protein